MPTALKIVSRSMRMFGGIESGEIPSLDEQADGFEALNSLLSAWSARTWIIPYRTRDAAMAVPSSANSYSIGSGGDFNTARPIRIDAVTINSGNATYPLTEKTLDHYNANVDSSEQIPDFFYYEPVFPLGLLYFPTKLGTSMTVTIDSLKPFTSFALISTSIDFPPGYEDAIVYNLAKRFAPEFGKSVSIEVHEAASDGVDFVRTQANLHRKNVSKIDSAIRGSRSRGFDVISGR